MSERSGRGSSHERTRLHLQFLRNRGKYTEICRISAMDTKDLDYKGYTHHASKDDPQYEIRSDKTDYVALHKGRGLRRARPQA